LILVLNKIIVFVFVSSNEPDYVCQSSTQPSIDERRC